MTVLLKSLLNSGPLLFIERIMVIFNLLKITIYIHSLLAPLRARDVPSPVQSSSPSCPACLLTHLPGVSSAYSPNSVSSSLPHVLPASPGFPSCHRSHPAKATRDLILQEPLYCIDRIQLCPRSLPSPASQLVLLGPSHHYFSHTSRSYSPACHLCGTVPKALPRLPSLDSPPWLSR